MNITMSMVSMMLMILLQEWLIKCASIDPEQLHSTCQKVTVLAGS